MYSPSVTGLKRWMILSLSAMSFTEKMGVLEFLIALLMEHEKRLDELVYCLELFVEQLEDEGSVSEVDLGGYLSDMDARLKDMR